MTTVTRRMWLRGQQMFVPGLVSSFYGSCCLGTVMTVWPCIFHQFSCRAQLGGILAWAADLHHMYGGWLFWAPCRQPPCPPLAPCPLWFSEVIRCAESQRASGVSRVPETKVLKQNMDEPTAVHTWVGWSPTGPSPTGPPLGPHCLDINVCSIPTWDSSPKTRNEILMTTCLWFKTTYQTICSSFPMFSLFKVDIRLMERKRLY